MRPSRLPLLTTLAVLAFFYLPIALLVLNSFNNAAFTTEWKGFTTRWYVRLFERQDILDALSNSLRIAAISSLVSMILGTVAAFALVRFRSRFQSLHRALLLLPLVVPDILMGLSLLLLFVTLGLTLSLTTITLCHITFCLSYVALVVMARLHEFDFQLVEAARDLGASKLQAFFRITLPLIAPGIIAGGLLAFTLSIDDYVITYFVKGPGADTLPTLVYSMIKKSRELPVINALSTLMLVLTFVTVALTQRLTLRHSTSPQSH